MKLVTAIIASFLFVSASSAQTSNNPYHKGLPDERIEAGSRFSIPPMTGVDASSIQLNTKLEPLPLKETPLVEISALQPVASLKRKKPFMLQGVGGSGGIGGTGGIGGGVSAGGCSPPTMTYRYTAANPSNTCGVSGGSSCTTNGQLFFSEASLATANTATWNGSGTQPTYATAVINSLPGVGFTAGSLTFATPLPSAITSFTFYATLQFASSSPMAIIGPTNSGGIEWRIDADFQDLLSAGTSNLAGGSTAWTPGTWYTFVVTYVTSTGVANFYRCVSGTCNTDGGGTNATTFSQPTDLIGNYPVFGDAYNGQIAEIGILVNGVSTTGIGTYSQCQYGI